MMSEVGHRIMLGSFEAGWVSVVGCARRGCHCVCVRARVWARVGCGFFFRVLSLRDATALVSFLFSLSMYADLKPET